MTYSEKLKDPRWQKKRLEVFNSANWKCEKCGNGNETLHVHHLKYVSGRDPWEYSREELQCLCETHHTGVHFPTAEPAPIALKPQLSIPPERHLLLVILYFQDYAEAFARFFNLEWIRDTGPAGVVLRRVVESIRAGVSVGVESDALFTNSDEKKFIAELLFDSSHIPEVSPDRVGEEGIMRLRNVGVEARMREIDLLLHKHALGAETDALSLLKERSTLQVELRSRPSVRVIPPNQLERYTNGW